MKTVIGLKDMPNLAGVNFTQRRKLNTKRISLRAREVFASLRETDSLPGV